MLVLSPIAWDHYFLLLILPIAQLWIALIDTARRASSPLDAARRHMDLPG